MSSALKNEPVMYIHRLDSQGLVHNDIRPAQIPLEKSERTEIIDFTRFRYKSETEAPLQDSDHQPLSAFDLAQKLGLIGTFSGPPDLSTNKAYFDDFGQ